MTDIKVPISAPGATQAAKEVLATAAAMDELVRRGLAAAKGTKDFNAQIEKEAALLNTKVSPALKKAREEMATYNALMDKGRLAQGRSFLAGSSLAGGGGGGGGVFGGGGDGNGGIIGKQIGQALGRMGGPAGQIFSGLGHAAGAASLAMGAFTAVAVIGGLTVRRWLQAEERRLDSIEQETKIRIDLNNVLKTAREGQQDRAKNSYLSNRDSMRVIAATSGMDAYQARERVNRISELGDPEAMKAMAGFLKSRNGSRIGFENGLGMAKDVAASGAMSVSEALQQMASSKGRFTVDSMVAKGFGQRGRGNRDTTSKYSDRVSSYWDLEGYDTADEMHRQSGEAGMREGQDMGLVLPSMARELKNALDPVGISADKFKKALDDSLEPLRARANAENALLQAYKENGLYKFLFGTESEREKYAREYRKNANATR